MKSATEAMVFGKNQNGFFYWFLQQQKSASGKRQIFSTLRIKKEVLEQSARY